MVVTTANVFGNFNLKCNKPTNGFAIKDKTAAMAIYTITACVLYKRKMIRAIPTNAPTAFNIPLAIVFDVILLI